MGIQMDDLKLAEISSATPIAMDSAGAWLPPEAPRPMPAQDFGSGKLYAPPPATSPADINLRRIFIFGAALSLGALGTWIVGDSLSWHGWEPLEVAFIVLFAFLFTWMAFAFLSF